MHAPVFQTTAILSRALDYKSNHWLTINARYKSMRQWHFILPLALTLILGGCASCPTTGVDARASNIRPAFAVSRFSDLEIRAKLAMRPRSRLTSRHARSYHKSPSDQTSALPEPKQSDAPEPRPNSTEWWLRENVRVGKAIIICRVCIASVSNVSQPKQAAPPALSSPPALSTTQALDEF
jgi:hypothetical protein